MTAIRLSPDLRATVDAWADNQDDKPGRSEAIRRLVELGLSIKAHPRQPSPARARKAKAMAADELDRLADKSASAEEQSSRKHRLLHGPEEFRGVRVDRPKGK